MDEFNHKEILSNGYCSETILPDWLLELENLDLENRNEDALLGLARSIVDDVYSDIVNSLPSGKIVIPLSGGYDSRFILANMLSRVPKDRILAVTYGAKGNLDRQIAEDICHNWGIDIRIIDLDVEEVDISKLIKLVNKDSSIPIIEKFYNSMLLDGLRSGDATILSGFMGDPLTGGHYLTDNNISVSSHLERFFAKQVNTNSMPPVSLDIEIPTKALDFLKFSKLRTHEFLDIYIRQRCYISNVVLPDGWDGWTFEQVCKANFKFFCPFLDKRWVEFWISIDRQHHKGQILFKRLFREIDRSLAEFPSKYSKGYSSRAIIRPFLNKAIRGVRNKISNLYPALGLRDSSNDNYIDFERAYRERNDYITLYFDAIEYGNWSDEEKQNFLHIFDQHTKKKRNHGMLLNNIISASVYRGNLTSVNLKI